MITSKSLFAAFLALSVVGCSQPAVDPHATDTPTPPVTHDVDMSPANDSTEPQVVVLSKVGPGKGVPIGLPAGETLTGRYSIDRDGSISRFGVRIGNYFNESDGTLKLTLCLDSDCRVVDKPLAGSKDNDQFIFDLPQPISVAEGQTITYAFSRSSDSTKRLAIWTYPKLETQEGLIDPAGKPLQTVPRLSIQLQ